MRLTPEQLLELAGHSGLTLSMEGNDLLVHGLQPRPADLIDELRDRHEEIIPLLCCARCDEAPPSLVTTYWGVRLCRPCVRIVAEEFNQRDNWPEVVWDTDVPGSLR
jgi:hypothetical protein